MFAFAPSQKVVAAGAAAWTFEPSGVEIGPMYQLCHS